MTLQHTRQLLADGWSKERLRRARESGAVTQLRRGAYLIGEPPTPEEQHQHAMTATQSVLRGEWWFSHQSAAVAHGLPVDRARLGQVQVTRDRHGGASATAHLKQWGCPLPEGQRTRTPDGTPVTTVARTVADLLRSEDPGWAVAATDHALRAGLVDADAVSAVFDSSPRRPGNQVARERLVLADGRSESVGESISRVNMALAGLAVPELQHEFVLPGGVRVRVDFWWPRFRLVGELDGAIKYLDGLTPSRAPGDALIAEKAREDALRREGITVVRWGWKIGCSRALLAALVRGAIATAAAA